jgi:hypothetical protein
VNQHTKLISRIYIETEMGQLDQVFGAMEIAVYFSFLLDFSQVPIDLYFLNNYFRCIQRNSTVMVIKYLIF